METLRHKTGAAVDTAKDFIVVDIFRHKRPQFLRHFRRICFSDPPTTSGKQLQSLSFVTDTSHSLLCVFQDVSVVTDMSHSSALEGSCLMEPRHC